MNSKKSNISQISVLIILVIAVIAWFIAPPAALPIAAYHTAIIFIATIAIIVTNIAPTGVISLIGLTVYTVLRAGGEASGKAAISHGLSNFNNSLIWLIVIAFMIAKAFAKTGLGRRIALLLLSKFGQSTLRSAYCLAIADYMNAPATPSNTARSAIVAPIADSLAKTINADDKSLGKFLISSVSAMNDASAVAFSTGFAGNLALVGIAATVAGLTITFNDWVSYLLLPALVLLICIPAILYKVINPKTKATPQAPLMAKEELSKMGALSYAEKALLGVFIALILMWVFGSQIGFHSTTTAFVGLSILLMSKVLTWDDIKGNSAAFDTLIWFSVLMGFANNLKSLGFTKWVGLELSDVIHVGLGHSSNLVILIVVMFLYLLTAYAFASGTAKVVALGPVIIGALMAVGIAPVVAVFSVAGITNIGCNLTTYSHARNPLLMGMGYHSSGEWMKIGLVIAGCGFVLFMATTQLLWPLLGLV